MAPTSAHGAKKWRRGCRIGSGIYSSVFMATNTENGKKFAVKSADKSHLQKRLCLEVERKLLKMCKSPYVVKYLGCDMTNRVKELENQNTFNLLLELVPRGSVLDHIRRCDGRLPEPIVAAYTRDILRGLSYLHSRGIVHGDIKAGNCLIGKDNIKLCDLGSGKFLADGDLPLTPTKGEHMKKRIFTTGTDGYKAPEVRDETEQGPPSDIYSLGCTVIEMCTGRPPGFVPTPYESLTEFISESGLPAMVIDVPQTYSQECRDFVDECLQPDSDNRPDADELLKHVWFSSRPCSYPVDRPPVPRPDQPRSPQPRPQPPPPPPSLLNKCGNLLGCKC
ncbi:hypothetical protein Mapa_010004 [Marchantia paleacea]|nr:hypothetical protein Mapa_010004 [Marchantia paleacea]